MPWGGERGLSDRFGFPTLEPSEREMQASSMDTPTAGYCGTIFVAIELSQRSWLVTMHCPDGDKISHHRLEGGDHAGLLALVDRMGERATRALGVTPAVVSCYAGWRRRRTGKARRCRSRSWPRSSANTRG